MEPRDLKRAVRRAARGDEPSAGELFDAFYPRVYRYALAKLGDPADAEDVAAETFAKVLKGLHRFGRKGGGLDAWIFRIASNVVVDQLRFRIRETGIGVPDGVDERTEPHLEPEGAFLLPEIRDELREALGSLPGDQRESLLLRFAAGLDTKECGKVMGRRANAVRRLQFRGLQGMRDLMDKR
ncbi:MAG: sigma-70 family RNA polymerase sigma factor [Actinobacteria bacterium]|nr:sigma-70 family RNA polymerase sigma factor [Actinomycetota bacterium]